VIARPALAAALAAAAVLGAAALLGGGDEPSRPAAARPDPGRLVFAREACGSCHTLAAAGTRGEIGPDLDRALAHHDRASLKAKILDPTPAGGDEFAVMPEDYGQRMSARELDALVTFLLRR
jgi:cytochrome c oxidase subunit 2